MNKEEIQKSQFSKPYHWLYKTPRGRFDYDCLSKLIIKSAKIRKNDNVLDIGCGDGRFTYDLTQKSGNVYGIDMCKNAISFAKSLVPKAKISLTNLYKTNFSGSYFDEIILREVIEHLPPEKISLALKEITRICKKNGKIILTVPSDNVPLIKKHYQHFSPNKLDKKLSQFFKVEKIIGYNKLSPINNFFYRIFLNKHIQLPSLASSAHGLCNPKRASSLLAICSHKYIIRENNYNPIKINNNLSTLEDRKNEICEFFNVEKAVINNKLNNDTLSALKKYFNPFQKGNDLLNSYQKSSLDYAIRLMTAYERVSDIMPLFKVCEEKFKNKPKNEINILDYGCGVSDPGLFFSLNGYNTKILDIKGGLLGFAQWRFKKRMLPVKTIPVTSDKIYPDLEKNDVIICGDVLEHTEDPLKALKNIYNSINKNGFIYISPDLSSLKLNDSDHLIKSYEIINSYEFKNFFENSFKKINNRIYKVIK